MLVVLAVPVPINALVRELTVPGVELRALSAPMWRRATSKRLPSGRARWP
jgi:hypothetical protein